MKRVFLPIAGSLLFAALSFAGGRYDLPPLPSPERYGNVRMDVPEGKKISPVTFSHWVHRVKYTCAVCHYELGFSMKKNDTPIACDNGTMKGEFCARCHDGKIAFGPRDEHGERCPRCHGTNDRGRATGFAELQGKLPKSLYGNRIDWTTAIEGRFIRPKDSLSGSTRKLENINKTFTLKAEMWGIPSAVFPHKAHELWLDCSNCHPELFNIKKKTTRSLRMENILEGNSCGVCHLRVAFPLDDCKKCHPGMK